MTTRSKHDVYTAPVTLRHHKAPDGGMFVPFRMPVLERDQIIALGEKSFGQNVADMLELFFGVKLSGWDVDMIIGRRPCMLKPMNYRMVVAELFRNPDGDMDRVIHALSQRIHPDGTLIGAPSDWSQMAVRIALLVGVFGDLLRAGQIQPNTPVNIATSVGDFSGPMAAWYARQMGLPIDTVICGCNENGGPWELLHRGELDADAPVQHTATSACDHAVHPALERLVCGACGYEESGHFSWDIGEGGTYQPEPGAWEALRQGMFAAVVSHVRVETIIPSVYRTNQYILGSYSALAYGALADYRARTGGGSLTVLLAEKSPLTEMEAVARCMSITPAELRRRLTEV